ncbi:DUF3368 domain-containing protein [Iningainema sp. BLCCT55]|uniref:DUF3368 domain-containing protein n=2 Tax=Iningainema TaxID=1932705 RepID=A0A8J6XDW2_9CYAN|nr:DUF3368 domain-containing protein [Iningainema tapete BLCC-T55]
MEKNVKALIRGAKTMSVVIQDRAVQTLNWIETRRVTNLALLQSLQINLDLGEAEAIALAVELNAVRLIIDERRGRKEAIKLGVQVTGLLGILLTAKQQGLVPLVQPILDDLIANDFWVRKELYTEVLLLAGE